MVLGADGRFSFNGGSGSWTTSTLQDDDWPRWGVGPYGHTRKLVERPDGGGLIDGPISESGTSVFGFKLHYRATNPPGRVDWSSAGPRSRPRQSGQDRRLLRGSRPAKQAPAAQAFFTTVLRVAAA